MLTVRDIIREKGDGVWAVSPETSTLDALRFMAQKKVGALVVLEDGMLTGILSERDIINRIAQEGHLDLEQPIQEYMTTKVIAVPYEMTIEQCMQIMTDRRIRHLPVMERGQLAGLISIGDLVKAIISDQTSTIENLEQYIMGTGYGH